MAAVSVDSSTCPDLLERQTKSPSPLSFWTKVSPDPVTSPTRTVFTIVDDNAENSPRPPKPEFSKLEARGMVNLSSQWTREQDMNTNGDISSHNRHNNQQKPVKRVNFSAECKFEPPGVNTNTCSRNINDIEVHDDDVVIVTDKITQTEQPWPFLGGPLEDNSCQKDDGTTRQTRPMTDNVNNNSNSNNTQQNNNNSDNDNNYNSKDNNGVNGGLHKGGAVPDDANASEAPTLKVEYVGKVWDAYINDFLLASDHISQAAIYDKASKSCIACSLQFAMSQEEFDHLLTSINCLQVSYRQGIFVNDRHYKTVLADGRRGLMAKGEEHDGCSACQTRTLVLVAMHDRRSKGRRCNDELMRLGDFFWAKGL